MRRAPQTMLRSAMQPRPFDGIAHTAKGKPAWTLAMRVWPISSTALAGNPHVAEERLLARTRLQSVL
eukprot:465860-Prymnesium_polylepis.1